MSDLDKFTEDLKTKYPELGISKIDVDEKAGSSTFYLRPTKELAFIEQAGVGVIEHPTREVGATVTRRPLDRTMLDLGTSVSPYKEPAQTSYSRAMEYYVNEGIVGSATNLLASLACKGFENDIDDDNIKEFYDVWCYDVKIRDVLHWIYLDFFKVGHVTTYKTIAPYAARQSTVSPVPGVQIKGSPKKGKKSSPNKASVDVNYLLNAVVDEARRRGFIGRELSLINKLTAAKIDMTNKIPVSYTVLNPLLVEIRGSLLFNNSYVVFKAPPELLEMLKKSSGDLTPEEKDILKALPNDFKKAMQDNGYMALDQNLVGQITYWKQPYERYAKPRLTRIFDDLNYKQALKNADISTLDGISNFILKITVGNDDYPVTDQRQLETVAKLFNTTSKSFDVVWNHTLKIEKIVSPEIQAILGKEKYAQVNDDLSIGVAVARSLIDGSGNIGANQVGLALKGLTEEINYARDQVSTWLYNEYVQIATTVGFDRIPKVRWDDSVLQDLNIFMNTISQLVDRRMLSYKTAHELLGFDYPTELNNMKKELPLVLDGIFGIRGSPWQQSKGIQPTQQAPEGTPSNGRPPKKVSKPKNKPGQPEEQAPPEGTEAPAGAASFTEVADNLINVAKDMSDDEYTMLISILDSVRKPDKEV